MVQTGSGNLKICPASLIISTDRFMKKIVIGIAAIALIVLGIVVVKFVPRGAPTGSPPPGGGAAMAPTKQEPDFAGQEKWDITLIFKEAEVVLSGYPYIDKTFAPRLDNLIHIDTVVDNEAEFPEKLTDPNGGWAPSFQYGTWSGMYESSNAVSRMFIPIGRSPANAPIWQTMEIVKQADVAGLLPGCSGVPYPLLDGLKAQTYTCTSTEATKTFADNPPCFLPMDGTSGILYRQYSSDASTRVDMCGILKANHIASVVLRPY